MFFRKIIKTKLFSFYVLFFLSKLFALNTSQPISLCGFVHNQHLMSFLSLSLKGFSLALSSCFCCSCTSGLLVRLFVDVPDFGWYGFVWHFGGLPLAAIMSARGLKSVFNFSSNHFSKTVRLTLPSIKLLSFVALKKSSCKLSD